MDGSAELAGGRPTMAALGPEHGAERQAEADAREALDRRGADDRAAILDELRTLRAEIGELKLVWAGNEAPVPRGRAGA